MSKRRNAQQTKSDQASLVANDVGTQAPEESVGDQFQVSPATDLQYQIETAYTEPSHKDAKWSPRQSMAFVILVCGIFWMAVIWALSAFI